MGKTTKKKVVKKILVGFRKDALNKVEERSRRTGQTETDVVHDFINGIDRFGPRAERIIADYMKAMDLGRDDAIERMILDAMHAKNR